MRLPNGSRRRSSPPAAKSAGLLTVSGQSSSSSLPRPPTRLPGQERAALPTNAATPASLSTVCPARARN
eukprot:415911-Lingulodinium_polyedra.AAC.1